MKKMMTFLGVAVFAACFLVGCTYPVHTPISNMLYSDYEGPLAATSNPGWSKVGTAEVTSVLGLGSGDASIKAAMENGKITKIHHVDYKSKNVLGVYSTFKIIVYGE